MLGVLPKGPIGAITARGVATAVTFVKTMMMMMMRKSIMMVMVMMDCMRWQAPSFVTDMFIL